MKQLVKSASLIGSALLSLAAAPAPPPQPSPSEIVDAAPAGEWVAIAPADLLIIDLSPDTTGTPRRVVIQLMPPPFSQSWIGNIRKLAAAHWWDGTSVNRVQDNYVVQWGDATEKKSLPPGLAKIPESEYSTLRWDKLGEPALPSADSYAAETGLFAGWPYASDGHWAWPVHCYGMVGVGRDMPPDAGSGAELYVVIGQAPRQLDRNIALVGRVIAGIENLSSLPRGTGPLGFYEKPEQRVPIISVRLASHLPEAARPKFEYLSTVGNAFGKYLDARANRRDRFFVRPAGGVEICNVPVPVRKGR